MNKKTKLNRLVSLYVVFVMIFACFAVISFVNSPVKASLSMSDVVAYWNFEENTGTTTLDKKASVITMNQTTSVGWATGKVGYCWNGTAAGCNAQSNPVYSSTFNVLKNNTAWSVEFWAKASGEALDVDFKPFVDHGDTMGAGNWQIICGGSGLTDGKMVFYTSGWANAIASNTSIPGDANWHHFVFAYGGTSSSNSAEWYIDGAVAGHTISLTLTNFTTANKPMRLFKEYWSGASHQIYMDEVVIYNKKLSSSNVTQRWNSGYGQDYTFTSSPVYSAPVFSNEVPTNGSTCVDYTNVDFSVDIDQPEGQGMNIDMLCQNHSNVSKRQYFESSSGSYTAVYGSSWRAQTFTTTNAYYVTKIGFYIFRSGTGTLGDVTVSIRATSGGKPTGSDLWSYTESGSGYVNAYQWHEYTVSTPILLSASTMYAVVIRAPNGTTSNSLRWNQKGSNPYADGAVCTSTTGGVIWSISSSVDALFRTYGYEYSVIFSTSWTGYTNYNSTYVMGLGDLALGSVFYVDVAAHVNGSVWENETYHFTTGDNSPPTYSGLTVYNNTVGVSVAKVWSISLADAETTFNYTIQCTNGQTKSGNNNVSGVKSLNLTGLSYLHTYKVYVNVTDRAVTCPATTKRWWFDFTTVDAGAPNIDLSISPVTPAWFASLPGVVWFRCNISDPLGLQMHYYFHTAGVGDSNALSYNGTIGYNLTGLALSTSYTTWINVTNGVKWTNRSRTFTTRGNVQPVFGVPSPVNNTIDKPIGSFVWSVPLTDADGDKVNFTVNCSNGNHSSGQVVSGNSATLSLIGPLAYYTVYTIWVNITDPFGSTNRAIYYFTTMVYGGGGGGGGLIHNTHVTFHFTNATDVLDYSTLVFSAELYNGTDIGTIPHYTSSGDLVLNLTTAYVGGLFSVGFADATATYQPYTNTFVFVENDSYTILLYPLYPEFFFSNKWDRTLKDSSPYETIDMWLDKTEYSSGEQIIMYYHLPSKAWFTDNNKDWNAYKWLVRNAPLGYWGNIFTSPDTKWIAPNTVYPLSLAYDSWNYMIISATGAYLGTIPDGVTKYYVDFGRNGFGAIYGTNDVMTLGPSPTFRVRGTALVPNGNIVNMTPVTPIVGQNFYVMYTANNNGYIEISDLLNPSINPVPYYFNKPATETTNMTYAPFSFDHASTFKVSLYVSNGDEYSFVGSDMVIVNGTSNTTMGGNLEYLQMSQDRYVSGMHNAIIYYHTKLAYAYLKVIMPNGETSMYGINTTTTKGVYSFQIPTYAQIGKWNVSLRCEDSPYLYTSFYVVADDKNYVEFWKNQYEADESFVIWVTKTVNVVLIFYKMDINGNYIAQGDRVYIQASDDNGEAVIPRTYVVPSAGNWRVEMWETNARIQIRKLATYDATVYVKTPTDQGDQNDGSILPQVGGVLGLVVGLIIMVFLILSPFIVSRVMGFQNNPPTLVYAFMGALGLIITVGFGFFPFWVIPFMLIVGVIIIAIGWIWGRREGGQGL